MLYLNQWELNIDYDLLSLIFTLVFDASVILGIIIVFAVHELSDSMYYNFIKSKQKNSSQGQGGQVRVNLY